MPVEPSNYARKVTINAPVLNAGPYEKQRAMDDLANKLIAAIRGA